MNDADRTRGMPESNTGAMAAVRAADQSYPVRVFGQEEDINYVRAASIAT